MDPEAAANKEKQGRGATMLLLDVPQHASVGMDTHIFTVGPAFKGIKMIPPGPHFVFYTSSNRECSEFSPMNGFFVYASFYEVIIRRWDLKEERLVKVSKEEDERYSQAVKSLEFDRYLAPYALSQYGEWKCLSNYVTKLAIERFDSIGGEITVLCQSQTAESDGKAAIDIALNEHFKRCSFTSKSMGRVQGEVCYYTAIPRLVKQQGINSDELTSLNLDKSELLEAILFQNFDGLEGLLLGEMQFAYIAFLMGQSLESFLQWKSLVSLLLGCVEAPFKRRTRLFAKFLKVMYCQLKHGLPKEHAKSGASWVEVSSLFDDSWLSAYSFLYQMYKDFMYLVEDDPTVDGDLLSLARKLKELLQNKLGWELQQKDDTTFFEDDEFAPVVEILDEQNLSGIS